MPDENEIRTIVSIVTRGFAKTEAEVMAVHKSLTELQAIQAKGKTQIAGMGEALDNYVEKTKGYAAINEMLCSALKKGKELTAAQEKQLITNTQIMRGHQQTVLTGALSEAKFREELEKLQEASSAFPQDIKLVRAQQALLNQAHKQGTITLEEYKEKMGPVAERLEELEKHMGRGIIAAGKWALMWFFLYRAIRVVIGTLTEVIKTYSDLTDAVARVMSAYDVQGREAIKTSKEVSLAILDYGKKSSRSFREIAESIYFLKSAGLSGKEALTAFEHVMNLAIGTFSDATQAARIVAGVYNVYGDHLKNCTTLTEKFKYITDLMAVTYREEATELSELTDAIGYVGAASELLEVDLKTIVRTLGFLQTHLHQGGKAGRELMRAFADLGQNAEKLTKVLGITYDPYKPLNFLELMTKLHEKYGDSTRLQIEFNELMEVFGILGIRAIGLILDNWDKWHAKITETDEKLQGAAERLRVTAEDSLPKAFARLGNEIKASLIAPLMIATYQMKELTLDKETKAGKTNLGLLQRALESTFGLLPGMIPAIEKIIKGIHGAAEETEESKTIWAKIIKFIDDALVPLRRLLGLEEKVPETLKEELSAREKLLKQLDEEKKAFDELQISAERRARDIDKIIKIGELEIQRGKENVLWEDQRAAILERIRDIYETEYAPALEEIYSYDELRSALLTKDTDTIRLMIAAMSELAKVSEVWAKIFKEFSKYIEESLKPIMKIIKTLDKAFFQLAERGMEALRTGAFEWRDIMIDIFKETGEVLSEEITEALKESVGAGIGGRLLAGLIGGVAGGIIAGLGSLIFGKREREEEKIREATLEVSAGVDISNEQLAIINRNLVALRSTMEAYIMPESFYFRPRIGQRMGVEVQNLNVYTQASDGEGVVRAIEESFGMASSRVFQPS